jgi:hypothetical protein
MNVRCPTCGAVVALALGDTRLACASCGLATPVSRVGTAPGTEARVAMVALETDLTGATLAGRTIVERIGAGGMGTVYRARGDGGDVAIKVLRPALGTDRTAVLARFAREAEALRRLDHQRIVRLLAHGEEGGVAYIVTELVTGRDLAATLSAGRMTLTEIVDVFGQVCDGVAVAHTAGIVHRDLKPANILVGSDGAVKVADFGLAQLGPESALTTLTRTDVAMGTFHYLAPEQRKDARAVDHRADVWALGVILYEMLTGELPLGSFAPASTLGPSGCDRNVDAIVRRALAPDPAERFASVAELGRAVRALVARRASSRRWVAMAAGMVLIAGTTGAVAMIVGERGPANVTPQVAAIALDATTNAATDAAIDPPIDAEPIDAPVLVDAGAPIDAAVAAPAPRARPRTTLGGKTPRVKRVTKPPADDPAPTKGALAPAPRCRVAQRCCVAVKGNNCAALLTGDADSCESALVGFRQLTTSRKVLDRCK